MTTRAVENVVEKFTIEAYMRPYHVGGHGDPEDVNPPLLRHSIVYRMIESEGV